MPQIDSYHIVPYAIETVYDAFADVEAYPRILTYIQAVNVSQNSVHSINARIVIRISLFRITYTCKIDFQPHARIEIEAVDGPFRHLRSTLKFTALLPEQTRIDYKFNARFKSRVLEKLANRMFRQTFAASLRAFEDYMVQRLTDA